ncbi:MAG: hypothetical protein IJ390_01650 [Lachnospiraceae bacterium]|nr:hypothetical protein [Lachnospiraceae bacterium]
MAEITLKWVQVKNEWLTPRKSPDIGHGAALCSSAPIVEKFYGHGEQIFSDLPTALPMEESVLPVEESALPVEELELSMEELELPVEELELPVEELEPARG